MNNETNPPSHATHVAPAGDACERVRGRLPELIDGGLVALEEARDLGHLEACAACAAEAADWRRFHGELGVALGGPSQAPVALVAGLDAQLAGVTIAPPPVEPRPRVVLRPLQSVAAVAASLVLLFGLEALGSAMDGAERGAETRPLLAPAGLETRVWPRGLGLPTGLIPGVELGTGAADVPVGELLEVVR